MPNHILLIGKAMTVSYMGRRKRNMAQIRAAIAQQELLYSTYVKEKIPDASARYFSCQDQHTLRGHIIVIGVPEDGSWVFHPILPENVFAIGRVRKSRIMAWKSAYIELKKFEEGKKAELIFKEPCR